MRRLAHARGTEGDRIGSVKDDRIGSGPLATRGFIFGGTLLPLPLVELLVGLGKAGDEEGVVGVGGRFGSVVLSKLAREPHIVILFPHHG